MVSKPHLPWLKVPWVFKKTTSFFSRGSTSDTLNIGAPGSPGGSRPPEKGPGAGAVVRRGGLRRHGGQQPDGLGGARGEPGSWAMGHGCATKGCRPGVSMLEIQKEIGEPI